MAFFRIKKIKGKEYAYIVENEWKKKGSRQKVMGYLGRVYRFSLMNDVGFLEHLKIDNIENYVNNNDAFKIMSHLIEWELYRFNINKKKFLYAYLESYIKRWNNDLIMVKLIGVLLIVSSLLSIISWTYVDARYGNSPQIAGNVVSTILTQPKIELGFADYFEGIALSYSIISLIMGIVFLFRV